MNIDILSAFGLIVLAALFSIVSMFFCYMYVEMSEREIARFFGFDLTQWRIMPLKRKNSFRKRYNQYLKEMKNAEKE